MDAHNVAVQVIENKVQKFHDLQKPFRNFHGSTNSTRPSQRTPDKSVDTSGLKNVLQIDEKAMTAIVEPNVPMDALLLATLEHNLLPLVVMEFPGITVGGGFSGTSGESSSFRHGFFDSTVNWIEIVLAKGETVRASRTHLPDLFWGAASSFGTLGVITLLEIQLRPAAKYVQLTCSSFDNMDAAMAEMGKETINSAVDYLDGIVYSHNEIVICSGKLCDHIPPKAVVTQYTRRHDPWFYIHVQRQTSKSRQPIVLFIPIFDYLFRYDRGAFWVGKYAFQYFLTPFNRITRYILDRFMHTRVMYHALHASGQSKIYIIQDVAIPYNGASDFLNWLETNLTIYPLWLCPLRQRRDAPDSQHGLYGYLGNPSTPEFMMNFGVWGPGSSDKRRFLAQNRSLEQKVDALGGRKWLYAHAYYTEDEFWSIYDRKAYDALRQKYGAQYLPNVYDKVKVDLDADAQRATTWLAWLILLFWSTWPFSGLYGVLKAWQGGEYLLAKEPPAKLKN
ncbi:FAD-binding domain-containing protein [Dissoconium aciculare CBS 342.82]|uniref:Delta(24)-sterol reductase n=1 Tax=Dissoconium aciculare CBS 342.82 TaxID=1314786 RepID=A0A6J3M4X0_9PEZI|nr:FAD-binding domain-containing protein [Dissoconium aciculare CBS 342.82]KAF1822544.1 FAD-binding domain-containing protein [Dissoconium aciculare CBS 342.82]